MANKFQRKINKVLKGNSIRVLKRHLPLIINLDYVNLKGLKVVSPLLKMCI